MWVVRNSKAGPPPQNLPHVRSQNSNASIIKINLKEVPSESELKLVEREIRLHLEMDHPHIIKLWDALLEDEFVYMIMEYAEQGNLFYHQNTKNIFS